MKVKVCGIRQADNVSALGKMDVDYVGMIFVEKSPRCVVDILDPDVLEMLPDDVKRVGVFVDAPIDFIEDQVMFYGLDVVQLHGDESPEFADECKEYGVEVIKAFRVDSSFDFNSITAYENHADLALLDTKAEAHGGTGKKFDWALLDKYSSKLPFLLSGGIDLTDIDAIKDISNDKLVGIDVNSKFEKEPAVKDMSKLKELLDALK